MSSLNVADHSALTDEQLAEKMQTLFEHMCYCRRTNSVMLPSVELLYATYEEESEYRALKAREASESYQEEINDKMRKHYPDKFKKKSDSLIFGRIEGVDD